MFFITDMIIHYCWILTRRRAWGLAGGAGRGSTTGAGETTTMLSGMSRPTTALTPTCTLSPILIAPITLRRHRGRRGCRWSERLPHDRWRRARYTPRVDDAVVTNSNGAGYLQTLRSMDREALSHLAPTLMRAPVMTTRNTSRSDRKVRKNVR